MIHANIRRTPIISAALAALVLAVAAPATPTGLAAQVAHDSVTLTWGPQ